MLAGFFINRIIQVNGYYSIVYVLSVFILQKLIEFCTPLGIPNILEENEDGDDVEFELEGILPSNVSDKPMLRSLNEFKLWQIISLVVILSIASTYFEIFNFPVFWPLLLIYFLWLAVSTMKKLKKHQKKYKYNWMDFMKKNPPGKGY